MRALDKDANGSDLSVAAIQALPEPILFVGTEPVPMPYDYIDEDPTRTTPDLVGAGTGKDGTGTGGGQTPGGLTPSSTAKFVRVEAWIPAKTLAKSPSVTFRVPFCGADYQASQPLSFSEPTVTRMGTAAAMTIFRIAHPLGFSSKVIVDLDRSYEEGSPELTKTSDVDFRFQIDSNIVSQYQVLVIRIGTAEPYVLPIPQAEQPKPKTQIDMTGKPPQLMTGTQGPVEFSGLDLDQIIGATLVSVAGQPANQQAFRSPAEFVIYQDGERIQVLFGESQTSRPGRAEVEFSTQSGDTLRVPIFILKAKSPIT